MLRNGRCFKHPDGSVFEVVGTKKFSATYICKRHTSERMTVANRYEISKVGGSWKYKTVRVELMSVEQAKTWFFERALDKLQ
jgi:hypothetical protein